MILLVFVCVRFFDSLIKSSEEIEIDSIYGTFLDLSKPLVTIIVFALKNLMIYLVLSVSLVFISTRSSISLYP